jgi:hypothetical protein
MPQNKESDAEREAVDFLAMLLKDQPLPEAPDTLKEEQEGVYRTESAAAKKLHCIALVHNGKIMPYVNLEQLPEPQTAGEKMGYMTLIARTILDGLIQALCLWNERENDQRQDDDEGGCHV